MKNLKLISLTLIVVMFAVFMAGCSGASDEFTTYINETSYDILQDEGDITRKLDPNGTDDEIISQLEEDVIPGYKDLIDEAKDISLETKEINDLNDTLVEYLEKKLEMYEGYLAVYKATTESQATSAVETMTEAKEKSDELYEKFCDDRDTLAEELGVELEAA